MAPLDPLAMPMCFTCGFWKTSRSKWMVYGSCNLPVQWVRSSETSARLRPLPGQQKVG